jgi:hypothetical protein
VAPSQDGSSNQGLRVSVYHKRPLQYLFLFHKDIRSPLLLAVPADGQVRITEELFSIFWFKIR